MSRRSALVVCASVLFLGAARVSADPVKITSGTLLVNRPIGPAPIAVVGTQGFAIGALAFPSEGRIDPFTHCNPCMPGTPISLGGALFGAFEGQVAFDGNTFPLTISIEAQTGLALEWNGMTTAPPQGNGPVTLTGHFALSTGLLTHPPGVKLTDIIGGGTATVVLDPGGDGSEFFWQTNRVRYDFEPRPRPNRQP
jgi:hypothetical protein